MYFSVDTMINKIEKSMLIPKNKKIDKKTIILSTVLVFSIAVGAFIVPQKIKEVLRPPAANAATLTSEVYRFYSPNYKSHFYTISEEEKNSIIQNDTNWNYEGVAYSAYTKNQMSTVPLYRFYSPNYKSHFYTISEEEKSSIIQNDTNWNYEGVAYYVQKEGTPIYRFYSKNYKSHFYTTNAQERDSIISNDSNWLYEGIAFYSNTAVSDLPDDSSENPAPDDSAQDPSVCGIDHGQTLTAPPQNPLCTNGFTAADQTDSGPWLWSCRNSSGEFVATCRAEKEGAVVATQGQCGTAINSCTVGVFVDAQDSVTQHLWGCIGSRGVSSFIDCSLDK